MSGASRIFRKSELVIYMVNYICTRNGIQFKSSLQHIGTLSVVAWPACRLCYAQQYPSATVVSFRFHSLNEKLGARFKRAIISIFFFNCVTEIV